MLDPPEFAEIINVINFFNIHKALGNDNIATKSLRLENLVLAPIQANVVSLLLKEMSLLQFLKPKKYSYFKNINKKYCK